MECCGSGRKADGNLRRHQLSFLALFYTFDSRQKALAVKAGMKVKS
jgi:hypothetical protein